MLLFFSPVTSLHGVTSNNDSVKIVITNILNHCELNFYKVECPSCCHCLIELWTVWYALLMCYRTRILSGLRWQYLTKFWNFPFGRIFYVTQLLNVLRGVTVYFLHAILTDWVFFGNTDEAVLAYVTIVANGGLFLIFPLPKYREAVIKHSLVHKVFLDFFTYALPKQRSVSILWLFLFSLTFQWNVLNVVLIAL